MSEIYSAINEEELSVLRKSIAEVAVLGALADDGEIDKKEKTAAIKLASQRTFTAKPVLQDFYKEVEQHLDADFDEVINALPAADVEAQKEFLRGEIDKVKPVLSKLSGKFGKRYLESQKSFAEHIFKSSSNVLSGFFKSIDGDMEEKIFGEDEETGI